MKFLIFVCAIAICASQSPSTKYLQPYLGPVKCIEDQNIVWAYRTAYDSFASKLLKKATAKSPTSFVMSLQSVWITLAAIAEGADYFTQQQLFQLLNLPQNSCSRNKFYQIATTRMSASDSIDFIQSRTMLIDENAKLNPHWYDLVREQSLLHVIQAPIKRDPETTSFIVNQIASNALRINLNGSSVLIDALDFKALWTTAFADAVIERSPFFDTNGQYIGAVDLMTVKKRARIGFSVSLNAKIIELTIGDKEEYSLIIAVNLNTDVQSTTKNLHDFSVAEAIATLEDTYAPILVAVPRFTMTSDIDVKDILKTMGINSLWSDPSATRYISTPAALPSSYIHRTTVTFNKDGVNPPLHHYLYAQAQTEFIANSPFLFGLFDTETYTCVMAGAYTSPTYF